MKADAVALSWAGDKYIGRPYSEMDCQALVERMLSDCGIHADLRGSNAWYREVRRNGWTGTPEECKKMFGSVPKGALLFILKNDGGEVARGYHDGLGNASHIGVKTGRGKGAINSSSSRGRVAESEFHDKSIRGGWNMVGLWNRIDYGKTINWMVEHSGIGVEPQEGNEEAMPMQGKVFAATGATVNLRKTAGGDLLERIPIGRTVTVTDYGPEWCKVTAGKMTGWMKTEFIVFDGDVQPGEDEPIAPEPAESEPELMGQVSIALDPEMWAAAYPALKALVEQIEKQVGRG